MLKASNIFKDMKTYQLQYNLHLVLGGKKKEAMFVYDKNED